MVTEQALPTAYACDYWTRYAEAEPVWNRCFSAFSTGCYRRRYLRIRAHVVTPDGLSLATSELGIHLHQ